MEHKRKTWKRRTLSCKSGEGNGNALQYARLENLMDDGASWAALYVVAQSRTRLMQLSNSSSFCKSTSVPLNTFLTYISVTTLKLYAFIFPLKGEIASIEHVKCHQFIRINIKIYFVYEI